MRAAVLANTGDETLEVTDDVTVNDPGPGEVTIRIEATGVCHSDLSGMSGVIPQPAPVVLGHEGAGVITAVGDGVTRVVEGDHVIVAWSPPCGRCVNCVSRRSPHLCTEIQMGTGMMPRFQRGGEPLFGFAGAGTFAEATTMPAEAAVAIDDDVPFEIASLIGCGVSTGVGAAINTARVEPGSSVVVFGCGGVGIAAIQGARIAGAAEIVAVDLNESKHAQAEAFGATQACVPGQLDEVKAELTGDGFDYAFEAIGSPVTIRAAYDAVRRGGLACIVGVGGQDQEVSFNTFEVFFSEKRFIGSYYGSVDVHRDFDRLLGLWKAGQLDLEGMITRKLKIDGINDALDALRAGDVIRQVVTF